MSECAKWGEQTRQDCAEYRDEGYNACDKWDAECCDWWPCSWACKLITWVCVAWYWVSNVVCVAWTYVTTAVCLVWEVVVTAVSAVIETIESILTWVLSALAYVIEFFLSIPILGRILKWIWNVVLTLVWGIVGIVDAILGVLGILPEKKLRVCVILLRDEKGNPVANVSDVVARLQDAIDIYHDQANVRIIPVGPFEYTSGFAGKEKADESWIHVNRGPGGADLDVSCEGTALGEDLVTTGTRFELLASNVCFYSNFRRLIGYGAPVIVFIVRSVKGSFLGCSVGPLSDYVTIEGSNPICIAHETGHACNLWHVDEDANLMNPSCGRRVLHWWQVAILRDSRHVTYF